jgi:hypothetical protein
MRHEEVAPSSSSSMHAALSAEKESAPLRALTVFFVVEPGGIEPPTS